MKCEAHPKCVCRNCAYDALITFERKTTEEEGISQNRVYMKPKT